MSDNRRLFIHCGLHKTGAAKIQRDLGRLADTLAADGLYVPRIGGKRRGAHHRLAAAICWPAQFRDYATQFQALCAELATETTRDACVSSEGFETCLGRPRALARLFALAEAAGARPVFVIYLRNQIEYFEALYLHLLRSGCDTSATEMLEAIEGAGRVEWRGRIFHFDYWSMLETLRTLDCEVVLRDAEALTDSHPTADFLAVTGQGAISLPIDTDGRDRAVRPSTNLTRFVANRAASVDRAALRVIDDAIKGKTPQLSASWRARLAERFRAGNARIAADWGIDLNARLSTLEPEPGTPLIDRIFRDTTRDWAAAKLVDGGGPITEDAVRAFSSDWFTDRAPDGRAA